MQPLAVPDALWDSVPATLREGTHYTILISALPEGIVNQLKIVPYQMLEANAKEMCDEGKSLENACSTLRAMNSNHPTVPMPMLQPMILMCTMQNQNWSDVGDSFTIVNQLYSLYLTVALAPENIGARATFVDEKIRIPLSKAAFDDFDKQYKALDDAASNGGGAGRVVEVLEAFSRLVQRHMLMLVRITEYSIFLLMNLEDKFYGALMTPNNVDAVVKRFSDLLPSVQSALRIKMFKELRDKWDNRKSIEKPFMEKNVALEGAAPPPPMPDEPVRDVIEQAPVAPDATWSIEWMRVLYNIMNDTGNYL